MPRNTVSAFFSSNECRYIYNEQSQWVLSASGDQAKTNVADYWDRNFISKGYGQLLAKNVPGKELASLNDAHGKLLELLKQWDGSERTGPLAMDLLMAMQTLRDATRHAAGAELAIGQLPYLFGDLLFTVMVDLEAAERGTDAAEVRSVLKVAMACDRASTTGIPERLEDVPGALYWETILDLVPPDAKPAADALWKVLRKFEATDDFGKLQAAERTKLYDEVLKAASNLKVTLEAGAPGRGFAASRLAPIADAAFEAVAGVVPRAEASWVPASAPPGLLRYDGSSSLPTIGTRGGRFDPAAPNAGELARIDRELARERAELAARIESERGI